MNQEQKWPWWKKTPKTWKELGAPWSEGDAANLKDIMAPVGKAAQKAGEDLNTMASVINTELAEAVQQKIDKEILQGTQVQDVPDDHMYVPADWAEVLGIQVCAECRLHPDMHVPEQFPTRPPAPRHVPSAVTVTAVSVWDSATGGNLLAKVPLTATTLQPGDTITVTLGLDTWKNTQVTFPPGQTSVQQDGVTYTLDTSPNGYWPSNSFTVRAEQTLFPTYETPNSFVKGEFP